MRNSFRIARIGGIDVYIHWSWLLIVAFLTVSLGSYYQQTFSQWSNGTAYTAGFVSAILLFVTVLLHELAHSFTARANGLPVNTITLFILGGVSSLTQEPPTARIELLVAIAGPLTSLVLAGIFYVIHQVTSGLPTPVLAVVGYLAYINLFLALFNLIPGFPLDGGRVLRAILWMVMGSLQRATRVASVIGQGIGILFIVGGVTVRRHFQLSEPRHG
jgi:Zn-dependent protease